MSGWQNFIEEHKEKYVGELSDFLSIPSISSLSEHADDVRRAGEWVAERLRKAGMEAVEVMPTGGHPVVYGQWLHAPRQADGFDLRSLRCPAGGSAGTLDDAAV